ALRGFPGRAGRVRPGGLLRDGLAGPADPGGTDLPDHGLEGGDRVLAERLRAAPRAAVRPDDRAARSDPGRRAAPVGRRDLPAGRGGPGARGSAGPADHRQAHPGGLAVTGRPPAADTRQRRLRRWLSDFGVTGRAPAASTRQRPPRRGAAGVRFARPAPPAPTPPPGGAARAAQSRPAAPRRPPPRVRPAPP